MFREGDLARIRIGSINYLGVIVELLGIGDHYCRIRITDTNGIHYDWKCAIDELEDINPVFFPE